MKRKPLTRAAKVASGGPVPISRYAAKVQAIRNDLARRPQVTVSFVSDDLAQIWANAPA